MTEGSCTIQRDEFDVDEDSGLTWWLGDAADDALDVLVLKALFGCSVMQPMFSSVAE